MELHVRIGLGDVEAERELKRTIRIAAGPIYCEEMTCIAESRSGRVYKVSLTLPEGNISCMRGMLSSLSGLHFVEFQTVPGL